MLHPTIAGSVLEVLLKGAQILFEGQMQIREEAGQWLWQVFYFAFVSPQHKSMILGKILPFSALLFLQELISSHFCTYVSLLRP